MSLVETTWLAVGAVAVLLGCSAFFSSSEIAIFSLSAETTATQTDTPDRRSETLARLREDPHRLLVTLLVGNNVVNMAISSIITVVLVDRLPPGQAVAAATIAASFVVLLFGEILPKAYGLGNAEAVSLSVARPIKLVGLVLLPLVFVFDVLTRRVSDVLSVETDIERPYTDDGPTNRN
jgi:Mg2+/Co2+ transporter CorB